MYPIDHAIVGFYLVALLIAVFLAFMGKWHRRSGVMTTAEWMELRFGSGPGGRVSGTRPAGAASAVSPRRSRARPSRCR
jgi:hypothetical protein